MPHREPRLHVFNHETGKAVCGRPVERFGPLVTSDVLDVTCLVCENEVRRWGRQVTALLHSVDRKVFLSILETAGVETRAG